MKRVAKRLVSFSWWKKDGTVHAIIALLISILLPALCNARLAARVMPCKTSGRQFSAAPARCEWSDRGAKKKGSRTALHAASAPLVRTGRTLPHRLGWGVYRGTKTEAVQVSIACTPRWGMPQRHW